MSAPTTLTPSLILECAELAQGYSAMDRATKNALFGGLINNLMPEKIYFVRKPIQYRFDINPNDATLVSTTNYLWSLLGVYGLRALSALGQGGGEVIVIPTGGSGNVINIQGQIVELVVGDASKANPSGSPTPSAGDNTVTLDFKVMPSTENIFLQGNPVYLYPNSDNWYVPNYGSSTTTYTFRDNLEEGFSLKFVFMKIVGSSSTSPVTTGLQGIPFTVDVHGSVITVPELGTFISLDYKGNPYYVGFGVVQTGQQLDLTGIGSDFFGDTMIIFYYPQSA